MTNRPVAMRCIDHFLVLPHNPQAPITGWPMGNHGDWAGGSGAGLGTGLVGERQRHGGWQSSSRVMEHPRVVNMALITS